LESVSNIMCNQYVQYQKVPRPSRRAKFFQLWISEVVNAP